MIELLCYEPAGQVLQFTADELTRHVLGLGATGCGKTTGLINPLLKQTIGWHAADTKKKIGLLILDPKQDDTPIKVRAYASQAGRLDDVITLSINGDAFYGFFTKLQRLDQVDEFSRRVLYGTADLGDQNAYWTEGRFGLVNAALTIFLASGRALTFEGVSEFFRAWFSSRNCGEVNEALHFVERLLSSGKLRPASQRRLQLALAEAANWNALDTRTRELHKSTINNALRSLFSTTARDLFDEQKGRRFDPSEVLTGKILVASLNAVCHPQLTAMLFKALKRDYYEAVLARAFSESESERLCGMLLDELPLSVMPEDVDSLALLRSRGGFVVACAQGLSALDEALGPRRREALITNFNSILYFGSRDNQTDEHAMLTLGTREVADDPAAERSHADLKLLEPTPRQLSWICPPGTLARLPQHHAYAKMANGSVTKAPVWLEPAFHDFVSPPAKQEQNDLLEAIRQIRAIDEEAAKINADVPMLLVNMHRRGHELKLTENIVAATWQLCQTRRPRTWLLSRRDESPDGLHGLPSCWLSGLSHWLHRNGSLTPSILRVGVKSGVLWVELDDSAKLWGDGPLAIPEAINLFIYPSLWRPLLQRHLAQLRVERPDLRAELESLPQVTQKTVSV